MEHLLANKAYGMWFSNTQLNNRWAFLINCSSGVIMFFAGIVFIINNWFTIDKILIEGDIKYITPVQLAYIAKNKLHGTFFTLNIAELKREFLSIPWVSKVAVKRIFPSTLVVNIDEHKVVARIGDDALIASNGQIFNGADNDPRLPVFQIRPDQVNLALTRFEQIQQTLLNHQQRIVNLRLNLSKLTVIETDKNLQITMCGKEINDKLIMLDRYLDKLYALNPQLTMINMCYKNALAINAGQNFEVNPQ